jgi:hypothetical protein
VHRIDWTVRGTLLAIACFLGLIAMRPLVVPESEVLAQSATFDHVYIVSSLFVYKGGQGLLVMDRRNGKVWFLPRRAEVGAPLFADPVFVDRLPFEKLDQPTTQ